VRLKLNPAQKLLIVIAVMLFIAGAGRLAYFRIQPCESVVLSIGNLTKSAAYEQDMLVSFQADPSHWSSQSIPADMINDMLISADYRKTRDASGLNFTVSSLNTQQTLLKGQIYTDAGLTALTIDDKVFYSRQPLSFDLWGGLSDGLKDYQSDIRYQAGGIPLPVNDYGRQDYMVMGNFSLSMDSNACAGLLDKLISGADTKLAGVSAYLAQIPIDSADKIDAQFQTDDFFRLRGIHAEISSAQVTTTFELNTTRIGGDINIVSPDISNGTDISNFSEDETVALFKEYFDSLAGGK